MSFFRRKEQNLIPPVAEPSRGGGGRVSPGPAAPPSYRSNASTYVPSRDGDPYNGPSGRTGSYRGPNRTDSQGSQDGAGNAPPPARDRYNRNNGVGDVYSRGQGRLDDDRNELFSGYNPQKAGSGRFFDGPSPGREPPPGEENDEDIEGIKQSTRFTKQESVNSTRNALRLAREAEETARNTLGRLGDQSEKLANTERHLDVSKGHSVRAQDKTDELKKLNRSIFRPAITFNKDAKRAAQEAKLAERHDEERREREKAMMDVRESQNRIGRAATYGRGGDDEEGLGGGGSRYRTESQLAARKEQRKRFQFEQTASDDEIEDELDDNLDEIGEAAKRLKALAMATGSELDEQNSRITRIDDKTGKLDWRIARNTENLKRVK
ncbi:hypothetical protein PLICRDRAFT_424374 [Plicaturopsis crispa FD-325 SS-3]|nr:hypothetical protein PLICRDRAFT_424374 [Plicaturopsis crispa FD-325 SS-3]